MADGMIYPVELTARVARQGGVKPADSATALTPEVNACELARAGKRFGPFRALTEIDLTIRRGERVALVGSSGAGKTTLLRLLNASLFATEGRACILGSDPSRLDPRALRALRAKIGTVHQQLLLVPQVSVLQNVVSGRLARISVWKAAASLLSRAEAERVAAVLERVGMASKIYERVDRLSGGEQQRVALARMLYQDPEVLIADEPTASVDPARSAAIVHLLDSMGGGRTLVLSTHRLEAIFTCVSRVIGLREGRILFDKAKALVSLDDLSRLYESDKGMNPSPGGRPPSPALSAPLGLVAIGASNTPGEFILPGLISSFVKECPGVRVTLSVKDTAEITRELSNGQIDVAFVGARSDQAGLHFEHFVDDEIVLVASAAFPELRRDPISPATVAKLPRVEREAGSGTRAVVEDQFARLGVPLDPESVALEVGTLVGLKTAVLSGVGVAFSSRRAVEAEVKKGLLREIPIEGVKIPRHIFAVWRTDRELSPPARSFLAVARSANAGLAGRFH